ncbi:MAG: ATP-dependent sacrificial sulfur transferase LarE [Armatimonadota bacterium]
MKKKFEHLREILAELPGALVAYSGGVDSTFLLAAAREALPDVLAVLAVSETYPASEVEEALAVARTLGVEPVVIRTEELANEAFAANDPNRCYYCKTELFTKLTAIAEGRTVLHGANADDLSDYRPGQRAACELGARAPLQEAGLTKAEIRALSKEMGLPTWDKPALACLSSRFPYGTRITTEALTRVDKAEALLRGLGFAQVRVRDYEETARLEVEPHELPRLVEHRAAVVAGLTALGYTYVTADLEGYRTGSMNAVLK